MSKIPMWLDELLDEYPTETKDGRTIVSDRTILRLGKAYANESGDVMTLAVTTYIADNQFFPRTASLRSYVENAHAAIDESNGRVLGMIYSDKDLLRFEQERGSMPADELLGTDWLKEEEE